MSAIDARTLSVPSKNNSPMHSPPRTNEMKKRRGESVKNMLLSPKDGSPRPTIFSSFSNKKSKRLVVDMKRSSVMEDDQLRPFSNDTSQ